jgi:quinol monooxygenase YgiN
MYIVLVNVHVKESAVGDFKLATLENAAASLLEPGIARFDVLQLIDNPRKFTLVEVYRSPDDALAHKDTAHYQKWRELVADMMAEPRSSVKYTSCYPLDADWR